LTFCPLVRGFGFTEAKGFVGAVEVAVFAFSSSALFIAVLIALSSSVLFSLQLFFLFSFYFFVALLIFLLHYFFDLQLQ
jgi:hypothetical protein